GAGPAGGGMNMSKEDVISDEEESFMDEIFSVEDADWSRYEAAILNSLVRPESMYSSMGEAYVAEKNWVKNVVKHMQKGALRKALGTKPGEVIPVSKLHSLAKGGGKLARRARLALAFRGMKHKKKQ